MPVVWLQLRPVRAPQGSAEHAPALMPQMVPMMAELPMVWQMPMPTMVWQH
jgi:hypothetical protein